MIAPPISTVIGAPPPFGAEPSGQGSEGSPLPALSGVYAGYRIIRTVTSSEHELLVLVERMRDGEDMWLRTLQPGLVPEVVAFYAARYEGELEAAGRLASTGAIAHVRERIVVGGDGHADRPGLVMDIPRGRGLDTILAESLQARPMREVLRWFRRLVGVLEAAHAEGLGHGRLQARDIFVDNNRVFVLGLTAPGAGDLVGISPKQPRATIAELHRQDVHALAYILYHATTGRPPVHGFPYTGQPAAPTSFLENYPESLSHFLLHRLSPDGEDPVTDAAVFRKALESLAMDPEFRRAAAFDPDDDHPMVAVARRERWWRRAMGTVITAGIAASVAGAMAFGVTRVQIQSLERRIAVLSEAVPSTAAGAGVDEAPVRTRADAWECIHRQFGPGGDGQLQAAEAHRCAALVPGLTLEELADELAGILTGFVAAPPAATEASTFLQLFRLGADEVEAHVRHRLQGGMSTEALDAWVAENLDDSSPVLRQLEARGGAVGAWARVRLQPPEQPSSAMLGL